MRRHGTRAAYALGQSSVTSDGHAAAARHNECDLSHLVAGDYIDRREQEIMPITLSGSVASKRADETELTPPTKAAFCTLSHLLTRHLKNHSQPVHAFGGC